MTRDNLVQQTVNGNNSKCDYIFADSRKIEKLKSYGNKIYVCLKKQQKYQKTFKKLLFELTLGILKIPLYEIIGKPNKFFNCDVNI